MARGVGSHRGAVQRHAFGLRHAPLPSMLKHGCIPRFEQGRDAVGEVVPTCARRLNPKARPLEHDVFFSIAEPLAGPRPPQADFNQHHSQHQIGTYRRHTGTEVEGEQRRQIQLFHRLHHLSCRMIRRNLLVPDLPLVRPLIPRRIGELNLVPLARPPRAAYHRVSLLAFGSRPLFGLNKSAQTTQMPGGQLFHYYASITKKTGRSLYAWGKVPLSFFFFLSAPFRGADRRLGGTSPRIEASHVP